VAEPPAETLTLLKGVARFPSGTANDCITFGGKHDDYNEMESAELHGEVGIVPAYDMTSEASAHTAQHRS